MELVSVVIPTYKRNDTLPRAINSVLNQTYNNIEVLVVDDNEPGDEYYNNNIKVLSNYITSSKVRHIQQKHHTNGAVARNVGVEAAHGVFIAFLDDDDEWDSNKIEKQIELLNSHPEIGGCSCLYHELKDGVIVHSCPPYSGEDIHKKIFQRSVAVFTSTVLLRKDALLKSGLFNPTLKRHQDLQLLLDFTLNNKFMVINEYLVRLHIDSDINRPNYDRFVLLKKDFFEAVDVHLGKYSPKDRRIIKSAHEFELAFSAIKEKKLFMFIKHVIKVGFNFNAFILLKERINNRHYIANHIV